MGLKHPNTPKIVAAIHSGINKDGSHRHPAGKDHQIKRSWLKLSNDHCYTIGIRDYKHRISNEIIVQKMLVHKNSVGLSCLHGKLEELMQTPERYHKN